MKVKGEYKMKEKDVKEVKKKEVEKPVIREKKKRGEKLKCNICDEPSTKNSIYCERHLKWDKMTKYKDF